MPLLQKISTRLSGWTASFLSIAGRVVLINAVLSSLPTFFMSAFKLPIWVIEEIDKVRRNFLWKGVQTDIKKYHLAKWELVCRPKSIGGLGVSDLRTFNNALLAKWYWLWLKPEDRIWKGLIREITSLEENREFPTSYFFRKNVQQVANFCECMSIRVPESGENILFWIHNWGHGFLQLQFPVLFTYARNQAITLREVMQTTDLMSLFLGSISQRAMVELQRLASIVQGFYEQGGLTGQSDDILWKGETTGHFTVRSVYMKVKHGPIIKSRIHKIWKLNAPPRMKVVAWLVIHNKVLTNDNLMKRGWKLLSRCVMCKQQCETVLHLFSECTTACRLYDEVLRLLMNTRQGWRTRHITVSEAIVVKQMEKKTRELRC